LANCELPAVTKYPVVVPVIFTVPDAWVNVSEFTKDCRTSRTPDGRVVVPERIRSDPVVVMGQDYIILKRMSIANDSFTIHTIYSH
jgi:hypothetical protein